MCIDKQHKHPVVFTKKTFNSVGQILLQNCTFNESSKMISIQILSILMKYIKAILTIPNKYLIQNITIFLYTIDTIIIFIFCIWYVKIESNLIILYTL